MSLRSAFVSSGARLIPADFFLRLLARAAIAPAMAPAARTASATPASMALCGISGNSACRAIPQRPAAEGLDFRQAQRAVAACARQHDAAAAPAKIVSEGTQEMVDGHPHAVALNRLVEGEPSPGDIEEPVGRHDMDAVRNVPASLRGFNHLERSQIFQLPDGQDLLRRAGMQDKHIGYAQSRRGSLREAV